MKLSKITAGGSLAFIAGVGIVKVARGRQSDNEILEEIRKLEIAILAVASGQYIIAFNLPPRRLQSWRYLDWLITTPLLLRTMFLLAKAKGFEGSFAPALSANVIMVVMGYMAEFPSRFKRETDDTTFKTITYGISSAALLIIFGYINRWNQYLKDAGCEGSDVLARYFYFGWSAYAICFLAPSDIEEIRQSTFNVLDSINKGFYSLSLDRFLKNNY